jgi:hypothetical protein
VHVRFLHECAQLASLKAPRAWHLRRFVFLLSPVQMNPRCGRRGGDKEPQTVSNRPSAATAGAERAECWNPCVAHRAPLSVLAAHHSAALRGIARPSHTQRTQWERRQEEGTYSSPPLRPPCCVVLWRPRHLPVLFCSVRFLFFLVEAAEAEAEAVAVARRDAERKAGERRSTHHDQRVWRLAAGGAMQFSGARFGRPIVRKSEAEQTTPYAGRNIGTTRNHVATLKRADIARIHSLSAFQPASLGCLSATEPQARRQTHTHIQTCAMRQGADSDPQISRLAFHHTWRRSVQSGPTLLRSAAGPIEKPREAAERAGGMQSALCWNDHAVF